MFRTSPWLQHGSFRRCFFIWYQKGRVHVQTVNLCSHLTWNEHCHYHLKVHVDLFMYDVNAFRKRFSSTSIPPQLFSKGKTFIPQKLRTYNLGPQNRRYIYKKSECCCFINHFHSGFRGHINIPVVKYRWQIATLDDLKVVK